MKKLTLILAIALAACNAPTEPEAELDCVPPGPEGDWCHHLDGDAVSDTLLTWPDSIDPTNCVR